MLIIKVELHSAQSGQIVELARMRIANTEDGTGRRGNYEAVVYRGCDRDTLAKRRVYRSANIVAWPRLDHHVWNLVATALNYMGYGNGAVQS